MSSNGGLTFASLRLIGVGIGALALAVSGVFGGLDSVEHGPPALAAGATYEGQPWSVTVIGAEMRANLDDLELDFMQPDEPGNRWLVVTATIEVTAPESRNDLSDILRLSKVDDLVRPEPRSVVLARDLTLLGYLNPDMPERVLFVWEQRSSAPGPAELEILVYGKTYRVSTLSNSRQWLDLQLRARVRVPVGSAP